MLLYSHHGPNKKTKKGDQGVIKNESPNIASKFKDNEVYKRSLHEQ